MNSNTKRVLDLRGKGFDAGSPEVMQIVQAWQQELGDHYEVYAVINNRDEVTRVVAQPHKGIPISQLMASPRTTMIFGVELAGGTIVAIEGSAGVVVSLITDAGISSQRFTTPDEALVEAHRLADTLALAA